MATAQISPQAAAAPGARLGSTASSTQAREGHRNPLLTALRGAGVFLDTTWRVVLLGGEGVEGVKGVKHRR